MESIVGEIVIDFLVIPTADTRTILIADKSAWKYLQDKPAVLGVKVPNSIKESTITIVKNSITVLNSSNLGVSCLVECAEQEYVDLPDGLYEITLYSSVAALQKTRYYFKVDNLQLEVDKAFVKLGFDYKLEDKKFIEDLTTIDFLIKATQAATRREEVSKAQSYFEMAQQRLKKYTDCKNCI